MINNTVKNHNYNYCFQRALQYTINSIANKETLPYSFNNKLNIFLSDAYTQYPNEWIINQKHRHFHNTYRYFHHMLTL